MDKKDALKAFEKLLNIMDELREKCPWDQKQTLESLRHLTIEEVYELGDAILEGNYNNIREELGDVLLHVVFYSKITSETNIFGITEVINTLCKKLIDRHPHIYGDVKVNDEKDVKRNWETIKNQKERKGILSGVPKSLPPMTKSHRIQEKVSGVGFDWEHIEQVREKVIEEIDELQNEVFNGNTHKIEEEFGDLLFSLINYARFLNIDPEAALERTNKKFIRRFQYIEQNSEAHISELSFEQMNTLWNESKKNC